MNRKIYGRLTYARDRNWTLQENVLDGRRERPYASERFWAHIDRIGWKCTVRTETTEGTCTNQKLLVFSTGFHEVANFELQRGQKEWSGFNIEGLKRGTSLQYQCCAVGKPSLKILPPYCTLLLLDAIDLLVKIWSVKTSVSRKAYSMNWEVSSRKTMTRTSIVHKAKSRS
ncbi:hypothetical protein Tco_1153807 [Tanacetum coccineum]